MNSIIFNGLSTGVLAHGGAVIAFFLIRPWGERVCHH